MMWFKREPKHVTEKNVENGLSSKLRKNKGSLLKPTRESSERETSADSDKEKRRYSDILDIRVSQERRDESDESLYESADCHSDAISASDDHLPRLKTPTISKESLKLAVTDEELEPVKKGHRKAMSLSNPLEIVKSLGDDWFDSKKEYDKNGDKKKSRESLWSEEDRDSIHGSSVKLDQIRKDSKKDKSQPNGKSGSGDSTKTRKTSKASTVSALNLFRRKKTPTSTTKPVESVAEHERVGNADEIIDLTRKFLESEKQHAAIREAKPISVETDSDDEPPTPKQLSEHRRRLSRQTSRSKSKVRGKSQSLKVNTLRKSHSGTLKKNKKKSIKTPSVGRSRQSSVVEQIPLPKKKYSDLKQNSWLFSTYKGESRREGSTDEAAAPDADLDTSDTTAKEPDKENSLRGAGGGRGVNRAESCRERGGEGPRRGKHRNASDPNRLTAHNHHDLESGAPTAPSGSSSSSSLSSRSNESNTVPAEQQASQSDLSEEDEPLAQQWSDSLPSHALHSLTLSARLRKRQEVIHELIVSEASHVRWLKVLGGVFLRGLEGVPTLLPPDELKALFPNLPAVRERHSRLYSDLRNLRANSHVVEIRPLADAMLNTLGDSGYASCLSRFCRGQRMALEALRERRRKNKELHQFLAAKEQLPLCGRLQLRDLLACVWQRLTKYQLLLEGIVKTVCDSDCDTEEDVSRLTRALHVAKDVLHRVDTAIRTAENEHRLRSIQSKLEVRVGGGSGVEWEELRKLDLTQHALRMEGDLSIRSDSKKISVLALMLSSCLVLMQREGDKYVLKPIPQSSQHQPLCPLVHWDKVLFRPNAAVRNTFFLMNINGVQMHELSANTTQEYTTWVKHIQEAPLAKLTELKPTLTPSHQPSRSTDDSGINVSRNPSDASEKSTSTAPLDDTQESERDRTSVERSSVERERDDNIDPPPADTEQNNTHEKETEIEKENEKHIPRQPTVGCISTHYEPPGAPLEPCAALHVHEPAALHAHTATTVYTQQERLRRLDEVICRALSAKSEIVASLLGVPAHCHAQVADLALADTLGQVDVCGELRRTRGRLSRSESVHDEDALDQHPGLHQLLLAAHTQVNQLTTLVRRALSVNESACVSARARGHCDSCRRRPHIDQHTEPPPLPPRVESPARGPADPVAPPGAPLTQEHSFDMLAELDVPELNTEDEPEDALECSPKGALLASQLVGVSSDLQRVVRAMVCALPAGTGDRRAELAALRDENDRLRAMLQHARAEHPPVDDTTAPDGDSDTLQDHQPSNGG